MGELVKSMELKRGLIPTDLSLAPLWLSAVISNAVTSFSVCVAGDYWSKTLSLLSHLQGEGGKGLGREKERRRKQEGGWREGLWGKPGRERRHLPEGLLSCLCALLRILLSPVFPLLRFGLFCPVCSCEVLSSLMSLTSQGHSNLAQDSAAFCRVALIDVWDVFVTLLDVSSCWI